MTTIITTDMLRKAGAGDETLIWMQKRYPEGAAFGELTQAAIDYGRPDWASWLGRWCPAGVEGATWEARLAVQRDDDDRAWLGLYCPAGVEGATWRARAEAMRPLG